MPDRPEPVPGRLAPCPRAPRCVSSDAAQAGQRIEPLVLRAGADDAWRAAAAAVEALPRTRVVTRTGDYLHAECRSAIFRFTDDLELELRAVDGIIAVRSCSRVGYYDFGVNRRRVESLREHMQQTGVLR